MTVELGDQTLQRLDAMFREALEEAIGRYAIPPVEQVEVRHLGSTAEKQIRQAVGAAIVDTR